MDSAVWWFVGSKENLNAAERCDCPVWYDAA